MAISRITYKSPSAKGKAAILAATKAVDELSAARLSSREATQTANGYVILAVLLNPADAASSVISATMGVNSKGQANDYANVMKRVAVARTLPDVKRFVSSYTVAKGIIDADARIIARSVAKEQTKLAKASQSPATTTKAATKAATPTEPVNDGAKILTAIEALEAAWDSMTDGARAKVAPRLARLLSRTQKDGKLAA